MSGHFDTGSPRAVPQQASPSRLSQQAQPRYARPPLRKPVWLVRDVLTDGERAKRLPPDWLHRWCPNTPLDDVPGDLVPLPEQAEAERPGYARPERRYAIDEVRLAEIVVLVQVIVPEATPERVREVLLAGGHDPSLHQHWLDAEAPGAIARSVIARL